MSEDIVCFQESGVLYQETDYWQEVDSDVRWFILINTPWVMSNSDLKAIARVVGGVALYDGDHVLLGITSNESSDVNYPVKTAVTAMRGALVEQLQVYLVGETPFRVEVGFLESASKSWIYGKNFRIGLDSNGLFHEIQVF